MILSWAIDVQLIFLYGHHKNVGSGLILAILQGEIVRNFLFEFSIIFVWIKARVQDRLNRLEKRTGYFSNDHSYPWIAILSSKTTKSTGGLIGRVDAFVNVPGITHLSDNPLATLNAFREFPKGRNK